MNFEVPRCEVYFTPHSCPNPVHLKKTNKPNSEEYNPLK